MNILVQAGYLATKPDRKARDEKFAFEKEELGKRPVKKGVK